jgi:hypothetical protein
LGAAVVSGKERLKDPRFAPKPRQTLNKLFALMITY